MVDPGRKRFPVHDPRPGCTITLLGISPRASRSMASITSLSGMSVGSINEQTDERQRSAAQEIHRRPEAVVVVVVGPDDLELEDDQAVLVEAGRFEPGADDHERARIVQLTERCLGRTGVARAFECDREGFGHRLGHGWLPQRVGRHRAGGSDVEGLLPADGRGLAHRDVGDPLGAQHGDDEKPDRTGSGDEHSIVGPDVGQAQNVSAIAVGSAKAAGRVSSASGIRIRPSAAAVLYWQNAPRYPAKSAEARRMHTEGRPLRQGRHSPHPGAAFPTTWVADGPSGVLRRLGHDARPLVAENGPRSRVALQDHVQVGSADPARQSRRAPHRARASGRGTSSTSTLPSPT